MPLGGATKKIQQILDTAEDLYTKVGELREQVIEMRATVQDTHRRVAAVENKLDRQGAVLEALAEREGLDVEELATSVAIREAEAPDDGVLTGEVDAGGDAKTGTADESVPDAEDDA